RRSSDLVDVRALADVAFEELREELAEPVGGGELQEQRAVLFARLLERVRYSARRVVPLGHETDVEVVLVREDARPERSAREADLEIARESRGRDVALEADTELRVRPGDLPAPALQHDVRAPRVAKRGEGVSGERGPAGRRAGPEVVEALAATGGNENDGEHEEKRECGSEAAHEADIGSRRENPRLEGGLRT